MPIISFRGRRATAIENDDLRVTVLQEGGHIAEILDKRTGVNPLWTPPWPSIEPSTYSHERNPEYGANAESHLLSGIMGHNLCLDFFGGPSGDEEAAGFGVHGEAPVASYEISETDGCLRLQAELPLASIHFERTIELHSSHIRFLEVVRNLASVDRPIGWTQHVTLGPPFVERGFTQLRCAATLSQVIADDFGTASYLRPNAEFTWPMAPRKDGDTMDLRVYNSAMVSGAFTAHLLDTKREHAFFTAFSPTQKVAIGYVWKRKDFPWIGVWEENCNRITPPWDGKTVTWALEFGVSPFPETRRQMVDRGQLFGVPTYRWLPAKGRLETEFWATIRTADRIPESLSWPSLP